MVNNNDYLALARDPRIVGAMSASLRARGNDALMSGVFLGEEDPQLQLETALATFLRAEAGVLCQSGWAANTGLMQAVASHETPVYLDLLAHMSMWQGARDAGAPTRWFRHNDVGALRRQLRRYGPGVVAVDSIYSTTGSVCPLVEVAAAARESGSLLVVDESHSLGTHGPGGAGLTVALGLAEAVDFVTASLSKAFAGRAGLVAHRTRDFSEYFRYESHPAVFSSTLLPHDVAGLRASLSAITGSDGRRERLAAVSARVRQHLSAEGVPLRGSASQIVGLLAGSERDTMALRDALAEHGVFGAPFAPPATTRNRSLVRLSLHAGLTDADVDRIVTACRAARHLIAGRARP